MNIARRKLLAAFAGAAAWPLAAVAQQASVPKVGWLSFTSPESSPALPFFKQGLADLGYVEGHNLSIEYAWARSHPELFPALAANLVQANVAVIAAVSGAPAARAAKGATDTIPIVFITPGDPVKQGLVASLNRPGGNLTGLTMMNTSLTAKQIELMHETLPAGAAIAILSDPNTEGQELESTARQAGQALGRGILIIPTASEDDFETAVTSVANQGKVGLVIPDRPLFVSPKRVEMLHELIPQTETLAVLVNPKNPGTAESAKSTSDAIRRVGRHSKILTASNENDIERVFEQLAGAKPVGLLVAPDAFFIRQSTKLAALSTRTAVPAMHIVREFPAAGGLISYGANLADQWRLVGVVAGRILQGAKPAELPVMQPTSFELVINIKTAKVLGLAIPPTLLALVDEVIE